MKTVGLPLIYCKRRKNHQTTAMRQYIIIPAVCIIAIFSACDPQPENVAASNTLPPVYPDYTGVTVPVNIAPLNFLLRGDYDAMKVTASCGGRQIEADCDDAEAVFDVEDWHNLMSDAAGKAVSVSVTARSNGKWTLFKPFLVNVAKDKVDPYLTYRLIEPDYEVFSRLEIKERCVENFGERTLCDYNMVGNRCMNCHTFGNQDPGMSFLYVRGEGGGMILNENGKLRKLALKTSDMVSSSVYAQFSPSGRYLVFSTNVIIPSFHANPEKRLEVFDAKSDVYVIDLRQNRILRSSLLADSTRLETFPTFSPDGHYIYYCAADSLVNPNSIEMLQYSLCRIAFNEQNGTFGEKVDTIVKAGLGRHNSVCHPRVSPDGKHILYTVADYGTFPIWHIEADLQMMDLQTGRIDSLAVVNSLKSDTYHSWASNSRWFVFASKRDDGLYGKPYFCYVDANGKPHKPFALPQRYPKFYDNNLKSFNAPELGRGKAEFSAAEVAAALKKEAETFR